MTLRRTKIVATLGPASSSAERIEALIRAGMNVARLNFSHGTHDEHRERARLVREIAANLGVHVALLGDLQGPKIRIARFKEGKIHLEVGDRFRLSTTHPLDEGTQEVVGIDYPALVTDCRPGDELLLDDGRIVLVIDAIARGEAICTVTAGGYLSNHKGINRRGGGLSASELTDKDRADIVLAAELEMENVAVSFPRDAKDMDQARKLLRDAESQAWLVAKIERAEAVADEAALDGLIDASDAVMVARGDLGVEIGDAELVGIQKTIIDRSRRKNKAVITATQMMESMISSPLPTRAEVSDVANAALDYTDAVMLSGETAAGDFPVEAVMPCTGYVWARKAPDQPALRSPSAHVLRALRRDHSAVGDVRGEPLPWGNGGDLLTESGYTPLIMSRIRSHLPIFALSPNRQTLGRVSLMRGVHSIEFNPAHLPSSDVNQRAIEALLQRGHVKPGDWVIITKGDVYNSRGGTNSMKLLQVSEQIV